MDIDGATIWLATKSEDALKQARELGVTERILNGAAKTAWKFIAEYREKYGGMMPSIGIIMENSGCVIGPPPEDDRIALPYLADKLFERHEFRSLQHGIGKSAEALENGEQSTAREEVLRLAEHLCDDRRAGYGLPPSAAERYGLDDLLRDEQRSLIAVDRLPSWPDGPITGHGLGSAVGELLAGGLRAGEVVAIGARSAGAGKTYLAAQLAEGLALRNLALPEGEPHTPVLIASEMDDEALAYRSLARWTGHAARVYRAGRSAQRLIGVPTLTIAPAWSAARDSLSTGPLAEMRSQWLRIVPKRPERGRRFVDLLAGYIGAMRAAVDGECVPIVLLDPIQRRQSMDMDEVAAINELVEAITAMAQAERAIVILTSDTNKASATSRSSEARAEEEAAAAFRGSYTLMHLPDVAFALRRDYDCDGKRPGYAAIELVAHKARWSGLPERPPRLWWHLSTGRFTPWTEEEMDALAHAERAEKQPKAKRNNKVRKGNPLLDDESDEDDDEIPY